MRVIIIALSCFFLIITAFSMKKKLDYDLQSIDNSDHVLHKIIEKLEREMSIITETHNKEFVDAEDWANSEIQKKTSNEDIKVRINTRGIKYMFEQLMLTIRHDSMRHPPSTILASYLGMELRINFIQIVDFVVPELHMEYVTPSIIRFSTSGGSLRYLGLYSAVYKTTREGQFEALLENMQIELTLEFDMHNGSYMIRNHDCSIEVDNIFVILTPSLPSQIIDLLKDKIKKRLREKICPAVIEYAGKITNLTQNLAAVEDTIALKQTEQRLCLLKHELISVTVDEYGILMLFRKSDSKRVKSMPIESEMDGDPLLQLSQTNMASVTVKEEYINEILSDLSSRGNIVFSIHKIPEIENALRTRCKKGTECIGEYAHLVSVIEGSGHLISRSLVSPRLQIMNDHARLYLSLSTDLSFENRASRHRVTYLHFKTSLCLKMINMKIELSEGGYYQWSADYQINHMKVYDVQSDFEEMEIIVRQMDFFLLQRQKSIEKLLSSYFNGDLPLIINPYVQLVSESVVFRPHQLSITTEFRLEKKFFPVFQLER